MKILNFIKESLLAGKIVNKVKNKQYNDAIPLLIKMLDIVPEDATGIEVYYYELGLCYKKIENYEDAVFYFSKAYNKHQKLKKGYETKEYGQLLREYLDALVVLGDFERAEEIKQRQIQNQNDTS